MRTGTRLQLGHLAPEPPTSRNPAQNRLAASNGWKNLQATHLTMLLLLLGHFICSPLAIALTGMAQKTWHQADLTTFYTASAFMSCACAVTQLTGENRGAAPCSQHLSRPKLSGDDLFCNPVPASSFGGSCSVSANSRAPKAPKSCS